MGRAVNNPNDKNNPVHRIMAQGHELPDLAQRRMLIYGNDNHIKHVINQPKMTHATAWLAHDTIDNYINAAKLNKSRSSMKKYQEYKNTLHSNFPHADYHNPPHHVHTNANYKPTKA